MGRRVAYTLLHSPPCGPNDYPVLVASLVKTVNMTFMSILRSLTTRRLLLMGEMQNHGAVLLGLLFH
eukprot:9395981-Karenia_brevis.AAC.1